MSAIDIDREAAHEAARGELAKAIYPKASLTERFYNWIDNLLDRLLLNASTVPGGWFTITVLLILLAIAIATGIHVVRRTMRTNRGGEHPLFDASQLSAAQHRLTAESYAAEGNWAAAIRHRLRAVARELEETGVLDPAPGRTANELAHDASASLPHLASEFPQAAMLFNDVSYGERPGTPTGYRMIADLDDHLRSRSITSHPGMNQPAAQDSWAHVR